ncbi:ACT domain-containing protein [Streptomyces sp. NPDC057702]|uniref:ACT domain-containing protein n=1 Tax=unclassified Streptomyces TaxID=2593676 RepID=UPI00368F2D35
MEQAKITDIGHDRSEAKITLTGVPAKASVTGQILRALASSGLIVGTISQSAHRTADDRIDITFTVPNKLGWRAMTQLTGMRTTFGFEDVLFDDHVGRVRLRGFGIRADPGVLAKFCETLARHRISIDLITTSELQISAVCHDSRLNEAVRALSAAFQLTDTAEPKVYADLGR